MSGIGAIIRAANARRDSVRAVATSAIGAHFAPALHSRWLPLPTPSAPPLRNAVAVDGTGHAVGLSTGAHLIVALAVALGPGPIGRIDLAEVEALPARFDAPAASSARDLIMRALETETAREALRRAVASGIGGRTTVWVDGSLFADFAHMVGGPTVVRWGGAVERAGALLRATRDLHHQAENAGAFLIGLAKTQRASLLAPALSVTAGARNASPVSPDRSGAGSLDEHRTRDGEVLAAMPEGWSWPLLLDSRLFPAIEANAATILQDCPAIVTTYIRPHGADLTLRLDVPASALQLPHRVGMASRHVQVEPAVWLSDPDAMQPFVAEVMARYGGVLAHNGPLHAVDRLVRLSRRELELVIMPVIARTVGVPPSALGVDRGRRRFLLD